MKFTPRTFVLVGTATAAICGFAADAQANPYFIGKMINTAQAGTCDVNTVGWTHKFRFTPAGVGDNGPDSSLSRFDDWYAVSSTLAGGSFDTTLRLVDTVNIYSGSAPVTGVRIAFTVQSPAVITGTTDVVTVTGKIKGLDGGSTCTVTFKMSAVRTVN